MMKPTQAEQRKVLATVPEAENLLVMPDQRCFVSGNEGLYQIDPDGAAPARKIPFAFGTGAAPSAEQRGIFRGIAQHGDLVYAAGIPAAHPGARPHCYLMLMDTARLPLSMLAIHDLSGTGPLNANGMAADRNGNLYLADFGRIFPPASGRIVRLRLSAPDTVAVQSDWLAIEGGRPNGIQIDGNMLYFSQDPLWLLIGKSHVKKVPIEADGSAGMPLTLSSSGSGKILDDLELVDGGVLVTQANALNFGSSSLNRIIHVSESGQTLHVSGAPLTLPSAVKLLIDERAAAPDGQDLIVTERGGVVCRLSEPWGLRPRRRRIG